MHVKYLLYSEIKVERYKINFSKMNISILSFHQFNLYFPNSDDFALKSAANLQKIHLTFIKVDGNG